MQLVAWVAFWPLAYVAAREPLLSLALVAAPLLALIGRPRALTVVLGALGVFAAAYLAHRTFAPPMAAAAFSTLVGGAFAWIAVRTSPWRTDQVDLDLACLVPFAIWVTMMAFILAHASRGAHLHAFFPTLAPAMALAAAGLAATSVIAALRMRAFIAALYDGAIPHLRVQPRSDDVTAPKLAAVASTDGVIVEGGAAALPYRANEGRVVARVPTNASSLRGHYRTHAIIAAVATLACAAGFVLTLDRFARNAHPDDLASTPTKLPPLPAACEGKPIMIRFAALGELRVLDIERIAERYRATGIGDVVVDEHLFYAEERFLDQRRGQIIGEEVLRAARIAYEPKPDRELVVVVTDRDMFLRDVAWRYAFATREPGVAVVSVARMDPSFVLEAATYERRASECSATVRARAFRMITRQVLLGLCHADTVEDPKSARRRSVMSLSDLDAIDEATY